MRVAKLSGVLIQALLLAGCSLFGEPPKEDGWERFPVADANRIYEIAFENGGDILVATDRGVFRSENDGETWVEIFYPSGSVYSLATTSSGEIYAGSDNLYRSIDRGQTWSSVLESPGNLLVIGLDEDVFVESKGRLLHSMYEGQSWNDVTPHGIVVSSLAVLQDGSLIAGGLAHVENPDLGGGVLFSSDNGRHWVQLGLNEERVTNVFARTKDSIYAVLPDGVYHTTDGGETWSHTYETYNDPGRDPAFIVEGVITPRGQAIVREVTAEGEAFTKTRILRLKANRSEELEIGDDFIRSLAIRPDGFLFAGTSGLHGAGPDAQGYVYRSGEPLW